MLELPPHKEFSRIGFIAQLQEMDAIALRSLSLELFDALRQRDIAAIAQMGKELGIPEATCNIPAPPELPIKKMQWLGTDDGQEPHS